MDKPMDEYLKPGAAAEILDLTAEAIRVRARRGELWAVKRASVCWLEREAVLELQRKAVGENCFYPTLGVESKGADDATE